MKALGSDSPSVTLIDHYYETLGVEKIWNAEKVNRLCTRINCTTTELAKMFWIPKTNMTSWLRADKIPPYVTLHFVLLENWLAKSIDGLEVDAVLPVNILLQSNNGRS